VLGWNISAHRQPLEPLPASGLVRPAGRPIVTWRAEVEGLRWIAALVASDEAVSRARAATRTSGTSAQPRCLAFFRATLRTSGETRSMHPPISPRPSRSTRDVRDLS
jgi:hypothetical protein